MKTNIRLYLLFCLLFLGISSFSQNPERAVSVLQPQEFFLYGNLAFAKNSSIILEVVLPENTIKWYYTFAASRNKEQIAQTKSQLNLLGQLSKLIDASGTTATALSLLSKPPGNDFCNIYLFNSHSDAKTFEKDFTLNGFRYIREGSRLNFISGPVEITDQSHVSGRQYLGFNNPATTFGITCVLEVVAIVKDPKKQNGWTAEQRQQIFNELHGKFIEFGALEQMTETQAQSFTACLVGKVTAYYSPEDLSGMARFEIDTVFNGLTERCVSELGLKDALKTPGTIGRASELKTNKIVNPLPKEVFGKWRDNNSTFSLLSNATFIVKWDNGSQANGNWAVNDGFLELRFDNKKEVYKILDFNGDKLVYQEISKEATIYTANRIKNQSIVSEIEALSGTWKDSNSEFTLYNNNTFVIKWTNGKIATGTWDKSGDYLNFHLGSNLTSYKVLEFTESKLVFQETSGQLTIYTALKQ